MVLERACELQLLAEGFGGAESPLSAQEAVSAHSHTVSDQHLLNAWERLVRRAERNR